jgi:hypothetical protein
MTLKRQVLTVFLLPAINIALKYKMSQQVLHDNALVMARHIIRCIRVTEIQNQKKKLRVGVFFGGKSAEKEVSLATGRYVLNLLDSSKYEAVPLYMSYSGLIWKLPLKLVLMNTTKDVEEKLEASAQHIWRRRCNSRRT